MLRRSVIIAAVDGAAVAVTACGNGAAVRVDETSVARASLLAFSSDVDGYPEVFTLAFPSGAARRVTHNPASDGFPVWAPNGQSLLFGSDRELRHLGGATRRLRHEAADPEP